MFGAAVFLTVEIGGLDVPDAGPVFFTALGVHVAAGATCVILGALAALSRKRAGRHPRAGTAYLYGITVVFVTATVMAGIRWEQDAHLFVIAAVTFGLAILGWRVRRSRPAHWLAWHGTAMAGSYIALLTGFYVDNGPQLPLWDRLPHVTYWLLPAVIGVPITWRALVRNGALTRRPTSAARIVGPPRPRC